MLQSRFSTRAGPYYPDSLEYVLNRGPAFLQSGRAEESLQWFGKSIEIDASCEPAYRARAVAHRILGHHPAAASDQAAARRVQTAHSLDSPPNKRLKRNDERRAGPGARWDIGVPLTSTGSGLESRPGETQWCAR